MPNFFIVRRSSATCAGASEGCGDPNLTNLPSATAAIRHRGPGLRHPALHRAEDLHRIGLKVANRTAVVAEIFDYVFFKLRRISAMLLSSVICSSCNLAR